VAEVIEDKRRQNAKASKARAKEAKQEAEDVKIAEAAEKER